MTEPFTLHLPAIKYNARAAGTPEELAVENLLASLIVHHPGQRRPEMVRDPILQRVAHFKAYDMAVRRYRGHIDPDGNGANWLVRRAGYRLPSFYDSDPDGNNIESLQWGGGMEIEENFALWMESDGHRIHILGENIFYLLQTNFGIGFVDMPGSDMGRYYCFLSAPPAGYYE